MPLGHLNIPACLNNLANALSVRFERLGKLSDVEDAIATHRRAIQLTSDDHPDKPIFLSSLGASLIARFERFDEFDNLEDAVSMLHHAVKLAPVNDPAKPSFLNSLGVSLAIRFKRLAKLNDVEDAIAATYDAIELTPDGHPNKPMYLCNLGNHLHSRFERLEELTDLSSAITFKRRAVALMPDGHPDRPVLLCYLGNSLSYRFRRFREIADIGDALDSQRLAAEFTSDDNPDKPAFLSNLGGSLSSRFNIFRERADIDEAISITRRALALTPDGHPQKLIHLHHLGTSLRLRFEQFNEPTDISESIAVHRFAVDLIPQGHFHKLGLLRSLALAYAAQFRSSRSHLHFKLTYDCFEEVTLIPSGPPAQTLLAAMDVSQMCMEFPDFVESEDRVLRAHQAVLEAIPSVIWLGQSVSHRYSQLTTGKIGDAILSAASAAISANKHSLALEWLEEGRNIVWGQLARLRNPLDDLRRVNAELALELEEVSAKLQSAEQRVSQIDVRGSPAQPERLITGMMDSTYPRLRAHGDLRTSFDEETHRHRKLAQAYEELISRARRIEGFENFLRPKTLKELAPACRHGLVAVINVHASRCDALVLCPPGRVVHVPLPTFSLEMAQALRNTLRQSIKGRQLREDLRGSLPARAGSEEDMLNTLEALWIYLVQPVLSGLQSEVSTKILSIFCCFRCDMF
jgi:tetratricopeptide (TPR) repeat protein